MKKLEKKKLKNVNGGCAPVPTLGGWLTFCSYPDGNWGLYTWGGRTVLDSY